MGNIVSQIANGKVVVLPAYCEAQVVPDDVKVRIEGEDISEKEVK